MFKFFTILKNLVRTLIQFVVSNILQNYIIVKIFKNFLM